MDRDRLITQLTEAQKILEAINVAQDECDEILSVLEALEKKANEITNGSGILVIIPGIGLAIIGSQFGSYGFMQGVIGFLIGGIIGLVIGALIDSALNDKKRKAKGEAFYCENIEPLLEEKIKADKELEVLLNNEGYVNIAKFIPDDYLHLHAINWFKTAVVNMRADSLKEAINLYEEMLHKQRLEDMQKEQIEIANASLNAQQQQISIAKRQEENSRKTAAYTQKIAKSAKYGNKVSTLNTLRHWSDK